MKTGEICMSALETCNYNGCLFVFFAVCLSFCGSLMSWVDRGMQVLIIIAYSMPAFSTFEV